MFHLPNFIRSSETNIFETANNYTATITLIFMMPLEKKFKQFITQNIFPDLFIPRHKFVVNIQIYINKIKCLLQNFIYKHYTRYDRVSQKHKYININNLVLINLQYFQVHFVNILYFILYGWYNFIPFEKKKRTNQFNHTYPLEAPLTIGINIFPSKDKTFFKHFKTIKY